MDESLARRTAWHAAAGLTVGFTCTFGTAPIGDSLEVASALFVCTPVLAMLAGALGGIPRNDVAGVMTTGAASVAAGVMNAILTYMLSQGIAGQDPLEAIGLVAVFAVPYGGMPGLAYAFPMVMGAMAARWGARQPRGSRGSTRCLVLVLGIVATLGLLLARFAPDDYPLWPVVRLGAAAIALACLVQAATDVDLAITLRRAARNGARHLRIHAAPADAPLAGVQAIASGGPAAEWWLVSRIESHGTGPYRLAACPTPVLRMHKLPHALERSLVWSATGLYALAISIGLLAASAPETVLPGFGVV